ncbi:hypothetical protein KCP76_23295 [Salmonella enterica subsp. enterica serovar Weltevreden]|nr:hypothetical protein KCP76_23295 [Salmonella enterica subsp. enterica serovar Weltevreden]
MNAREQIAPPPLNEGVLDDGFTAEYCHARHISREVILHGPLMAMIARTSAGTQKPVVSLTRTGGRTFRLSIRMSDGPLRRYSRLDGRYNLSPTITQRRLAGNDYYRSGGGGTGRLDSAGIL